MDANDMGLAAPTNERNVSSSALASLLDNILGSAAAEVNCGTLLMWLAKDDYLEYCGEAGAHRLDEELLGDAQGQNVFQLFYHLNHHFEKEELRALLVPHLANALGRLLGADVSINLWKR